MPDDSDIQNALPLCSSDGITIDGQDISLPSDGIQFDVGAIAKGYIADRLKDFLVKKGVDSAIINLGGNVLCIGSKPDGTPFKVGIQIIPSHPEPQNRLPLRQWPDLCDDHL